MVDNYGYCEKLQTEWSGGICILPIHDQMTPHRTAFGDEFE